MPTSTVPAVPAFRAALLPLLQARPGLAGVQVEKVWPGPSAQPKAIYLASRAEGPKGRFIGADLTGFNLQEESTVAMAIWSWMATTKPTDDPEADLFAMFNEVVATLQTAAMNRSVDWEQGVTYEVTYPPFNKGRSAFMELVVPIFSLVQP